MNIFIIIEIEKNLDNKYRIFIYKVKNGKEL